MGRVVQATSILRTRELEAVITPPPPPLTASIALPALHLSGAADTIVMTGALEGRYK